MVNLVSHKQMTCNYFHFFRRIQHSDRTFHKLHDIESYTDHGYLSLGMDRHTNRYVNGVCVFVIDLRHARPFEHIIKVVFSFCLIDIVPGLKDASDAAQLCDSHLLCGLPYYSSKLKSHE